MTGDFLPRRLFGWLALGVAAFTIYGSFVPFVLRRPVTDHPLASFRWAIEARPGIESRSDFLANFALGLPLGFCVLAWRLLDRRPSAAAVAGSVVALWPCCAFLAVFVEFGQLYFEKRTTSLSDIVAQSLGSAVGMAAFVAAGQPLVRLVRRQFDHARYRTPAVTILVAYVLVLTVAQLLPLDLSASPSDWVRKFRSGHVTVVPFSDPSLDTFRGRWLKAEAWLVLAAVYLPVGLLLAFTAFGRVAVQAVALGLCLAFCLESGQILVMSRSPSATDVLLGGGGVFVGWLLARGLGRAGGLSPDLALVLAQGWLFWLAAAAWLPFDFDGRLGGDKVQNLTWLPFETAMEKNYLSGLEEILTKTLLAVPFGVIVAAYGRTPAVDWRPRLAAGVALAAGVGLLLEAGQLFLPERVAAPMDVLYAAAGGWLGTAATLKLRAA